MDTEGAPSQPCLDAAKPSRQGETPGRIVAPPGEAMARARSEVPRRLEDRHIAGWHLDRCAGPGIACRPGLAVPHLEDAESPKFDAVALPERVLHGIEERVNHQPAFPLGDSWSNHIRDLLNEVGLGHPLLLTGSVAKSRHFVYDNP